MTLTHELTDTQLAQFTACGVIVVDGEPLPPIDMPPADVWREPTGEMIWIAHPPDRHVTFEDGAIPETRYAAALPVGAQSGTYWKSTQLHDGMRVWWWGGIHPVDFQAGWHASDWRHIPKGVDRWNRPWVAPELWRKLTEPCTTPRCDHGIIRCSLPRHHGGECDIPVNEGRDGYCHCADCDRGHQVVTLTATCPSPLCRIDRHEVTLGRFTIRLLPVELILPAQDRAPGTNQYDVHHDRLTVHPLSNECYVWTDGKGVALPLDPLPQPGQWAVQFEAVGN